MPNTFLTPSIIAREALATLYANTVAAQLVNRNYDGDFAGQVGDTITVRKPTTFTAQDFAGSITVQDATEGSVPVVLDKHKDVSFAVTAKELTLDIADFSAQLLAPAMEALSQQIDIDVLASLDAIATAAGAPHTIVWVDTDSIVDGREVLNGLKAPMTQRSGVWSAAGDANLHKDSLFVTANESGSTEALTNGGIGRKFGFDHYMDQNVTGALGYLFHRDATILASRPLAVPMGGNGVVMGYKGFGLRVVMDYDIDSKTDVVSVDVLYGLADTEYNTAVQITAV